MFVERFLQPTWVFAVLGSLFGLSLVFITPPFQVPDEPNHFYRAYQVSQGGLVSYAEPSRRYPGGFLPSSLGQSVGQLSRGVQQHPERRYSVSWIQDAVDIELAAERQGFIEFPNTALYSPVSYLPQAAGILVGRSLDLPPVGLLYVGRLAAISFTVLVGCWTLWTAPFFRWPLLVLLVMPMTLFQAASVSADVVTNALSFAFFGSILSEVRASPQPVSHRKRSIWTGLFVLVTLSKTVYVILGLLIFLVPGNRFGGRGGQLRFLAIYSLLGAAAFAGWSWFAGLVYVPFHPGGETNLHEQLGHVLAHPAGFAAMVLRAFVQQHEAYRHMFIGVLGWLDTYLPVWFLNFYTLLLLWAALTDGHSQLRLGPMRRMWIGFVAVAGALGVSLSAYCLWTPVASGELDSMQGRYLIPLAPVALLLFYNRTLANRIGAIPKAGVIVPSLIFTWVVTAHALLDRYYLP